MLNNNQNEKNAIAINELQLLLAEKRTALSEMRTGIGVLALPMSVTSVLIATSKHYDIMHVLHYLVPLLVLIAALIVFGVYLIVRSIMRVRDVDRLIHQIKLKHSIIGELIR